jgi:hypothetical protein
MTPDAPQLLAALNHVVRRRILRAFEDQGRRVSPVHLAQTLDVSLSEVGYHVCILINSGALESDKSQPASRTAGSSYRLTLDGQAEWVRAVLEASQDSDAGNPG